MSAKSLELSTLNQSESFASTVAIEGKTSQQDTQAVCATLQVFLGCCLLQYPSFLPSSLILVPPESKSKSESESKPSPETETYLASLVRAAHRTGASLLCSSVLAGRGSESDEFGDVAFWVGEVGDAQADGAQADDILRALGLMGMVERGKIVPLSSDNSPSPLPASFSLVSESELSSNDDVTEFKSLLAQLSDKHEFRVELPGSEGTVVHFLVGKRDDGYCGLAGVAVWAGE